MILLFRGITLVSRGFNVLAGTAVVAMMLLTCADVILRLFRHPVPGTYEIVGFLGTVVISFSLAYTSLEKGHIAVELLIEKLPRRIQTGVESVTSFIGGALFALIAWQSNTSVGEGILFGAAVLGGDRDAEQTQFGHLGQDLRVEPVRPIQLLDLRGDFARAPLADRLLEQEVFV